MDTNSDNSDELLKQGSLTFEQLFDNVQIGLMYVDDKRIITKANHRLADIFGYDSAQEMLGLSALSLHLNEEKYLEFGKRNFDS